MEPIYHTNLTIPIVSLLNGLILIFGFFCFGKVLQKKLNINSLIEEVSIPDFQNILVSILFSIILLYPICLFFEGSKYVLKFYAYIIYGFGILNLILLFVKLKSNKIKFFKKKLDINFIIFISILIGLALLSSAPVTNADSLDYHLFTSKYLVENGKYPTFLTNFHSSYVSGSGEILIALGLLVGSEQFGSILQFTGLLSLIGILKKFRSPYYFYILMISSPVIVFFVSSLKPQLFSICSIVLALSLIFFSKFNKENIKSYELKKIFFICLILFTSITVKFSFILSASLLIFMILLNNFNINRLIKIIPIILLCYCLTVLPSVIWKYKTFSGNFFELFYNPFSTERYGLFYFKQYLTNLSEKNFHWFVIPTSLGNFTHSLGLGTLSIFYLYYLRFNKKTYHLLFLLIIFFIVSYNFGQFTARFFLEPYMWVIIFISKYNKIIKINKIHEFFYRIQSLLFICILLYGVTNLSIGVINSDLRDKVLEKNAMSYKFFKWVNKELKDYKSPILTFERSISFSNNLAISRDHLFFVNMSKIEAKDYANEIKDLNPKFMVFSSDNTTHRKYLGCTTEMYSHAKNISFHAARNPLNKNQNKFDGYIYKIDTSKMPKCINPNKVDTYSRQ